MFINLEFPVAVRGPMVGVDVSRPASAVPGNPFFRALVVAGSAKPVESQVAGIHPKPARVRRPDGLIGIHAEVCQRGGGCGDELNVVHIVNGLGAAAALNLDAGTLA